MFSGFGNTSNTSGGSAFGSQQQQPQPGTSGNNIFGSTPSNQPATGGLFGSTQQNAGTGTSAFGAPASTQAQGTTGGLFGSTQTQNTGGGGLFGTNTQQQPAGGGGLFGSTTTTNNQPASGGIFGNTSTTQPASGGLFGSTNTTQQPASGGGGIFGNTQSGTAGGTGTSGGGLFGTTPSTTQNTGGGLFGSTTGNNTTNATGGSLFGTSTSTTAGSNFFSNPPANANTTGNSLFGNTNNNASTSTGGGIFGGQTQNNTSTTIPSFFGNTNTNNNNNANTQTQQQGLGSSIFGQSQQQPQNSLFGSLNQPSSNLGGSLLSGSTLGGASSNLYSSRAPVLSSQQQGDAQSQFASLAQRIQAIGQAWDPSSPECQFQQFFYNLVDPNQVHLYGRPPNATNEALWQKALRENPDRSCMVPVLAVGFDDLQKRVEAQSQQAAAQQEKTKELQTRIAALQQRHQISNGPRLQRASALQAQLTHRVLKLVQHLHLLIPALRSSAIRPEEEALRAALEDIDQEVRRPGGVGRIRAKLNELWALAGALNATREQRDRKSSGPEWAVVDEDGLAQITQILAEEQAGLAHLTKILQKDLKDLAVIEGRTVKDEESGFLLESTSTLRGSVVR